MTAGYFRRSAFTAAAVVLLAAHWSSAVQARNSRTSLSAATFLDVCTRPDNDWISFCHGYVQGIFDSTEDACPRPGTTRASIVGLIVDRMTKHPEIMDGEAATVVRSVLRYEFPCS